VAGSPDLYPLLVELNPFPTLLACLSHENTDIAGDTVELLMELTDAGGCMGALLVRICRAFDAAGGRKWAQALPMAWFG